MKYLIDIAYILALLVAGPKILYRRFRQDRYKSGWSQRLGNIQRKNPDQPCIWIHAVSVGEVNATQTLIPALQQQLPDYEILLTSTTDTGLARATALYDNVCSVSYYPFDLSCVVGRAMKQICPSIILLMELEIWPNLAHYAKKKKIPIVVINGRLSDKSYPRYKKIKSITRWMFKKVRMVLAQTDEYAHRFIDLGCPTERVKVVSSLKYDTAQTHGTVPGSERLAEQINLDRHPLWVAGGTGPGEEQIILDVFAQLRQIPEFNELRLAIVPRKPERFDETAALIEQAGFGYVRFSELKNQDTVVKGKPTVVLGNTMGDLKKFYAIASIVFVGRSLVPMGGSDMMESTALGKCTLFGPHTFNFRQTVTALLVGSGAVEVKDEQRLLEAMKKCLSDSNFSNQTAAKGQTIIRQNQGATQKTVETIISLLGEKN